jgi:DNA-binding Xre family transcriptional regulator
MQDMKANIRLTRFLIRHGKKASELARDTGMSEATVSRVLSGVTDNPRKDTVDAILRACKSLDPTVTYEDLFGDAA